MDTPPSSPSYLPGGVRSLTGVQVHRYRHLDARDVTTHKNIPVTTVHRMIVDLADVCMPLELTNVIHAAAYQGLFVEPARARC